MKINKKICYMILTGISIFFINIAITQADVYYGYSANGTSNQIPYNTSVVISNGRVYFRFNDGNVYSDSTTTPLYFKHTFCVDSTISSWNSGGTPNAFKSVSFYKTDTKCYYPGSSYGGGRIMYLYGQTNPSFTCNASLQNCLNGGYLYFQQDSQASWTLLQESYSMNAIEIDFNTNQTNTYNSEITNNTNNTANNTNDIKNSLNEDVENKYKQTPNQSDYNDYHDKEEDIISQISDANTDAINIQNNNNANLFIWDTITRSLQSNAKVMALMISILSIGIIKLILNR